MRSGVVCVVWRRRGRFVGCVSFSVSCFMFFCGWPWRCLFSRVVGSCRQCGLALTKLLTKRSGFSLFFIFLLWPTIHPRPPACVVSRHKLGILRSLVGRQDRVKVRHHKWETAVSCRPAHVVLHAQRAVHHHRRHPAPLSLFSRNQSSALR